MPRKPAASELHTDMKDLSVRIAGVQRNGDGETADLAHEILQERKLRLQKQNRVLDHAIARAELTYGDLQEHRNQVLRANATVKASLYALVNRVSEPLASMEDAVEIAAFLRAELTLTLNNLAYENTRTAPPEE